MKVLDCTLRDGAHVNGGKFPSDCIDRTVTALDRANIDIIELGLLQKNSDPLATSYYESIHAMERKLSRIDTNFSNFSFLLRPDRCTMDMLSEPKLISIARLAYYPEHVELVNEFSKKASDLGYSVSLNPIGISNYSLSELDKMIDLANSLKVQTFSVVDTNGALELRTFRNLLDRIVLNLNPNISIGLHFHENLLLGQCLLSAAVARDGLSERIIVDSSVFGMGRIPGNLATELVLNNFSKYFIDEKNPESIYTIVPELIDRFYDECSWGYNVYYAKAASLNINRTYPEYFISKGLNGVKIFSLIELISKSNHNGRFSEELAENILIGNL